MKVIVREYLTIVYSPSSLCMHADFFETVLFDDVAPTPSHPTQADNMLVRHTLKRLANHVQSLSLNGCYWLAGSTVELLACCRGVTHLDVTGCRLSSLRLSRLLSSLSLLTSLAFDVRGGFNLALLSSEAVDSLGRLSELRQTLLTPSYGVVPCCAQLRK